MVTEPEDTQPTKTNWSMVAYVVLLMTFALGSVGALLFYIWTKDGRWGWTAALLAAIAWLTAQVDDEEDG